MYVVGFFGIVGAVGLVGLLRLTWLSVGCVRLLQTSTLLTWPTGFGPEHCLIGGTKVCSKLSSHRSDNVLGRKGVVKFTRRSPKHGVSKHSDHTLPYIVFCLFVLLWCPIFCRNIHTYWKVTTVACLRVVELQKLKTCTVHTIHAW